MRMIPISLQQDAFAVEPDDDFQRLLLMFAGKLFQQRPPFDILLKAAQKSRQPLVERRRTKRVSEFFASDQTNSIRLAQNRKRKSESNPVRNKLCIHPRGGWS